MQISATSPIQAVVGVNRPGNDTHASANGQDASQAPSQPKPEAASEPKVFTPAPPLRPNVQDLVDINRTLIMLRQV